jgi:hypothetical protein
MDIFQREPGPSYVPAFAARLLLSMAKGLARTEGESKRALIDEDADSMWTLAMIVVQWYADALPPAEARVVAATLQEFEMSAIVCKPQLVSRAADSLCEGGASSAERCAACSSGCLLRSSGRADWRDDVVLCDQVGARCCDEGESHGALATAC